MSRKDPQDIDIAVLLARKKGGRHFDSIGFRIKVISALGRGVNFKGDFDVHLLGEMPLSLQYRVLSTGKCFLARDAIERVRYETRVLNEFLDFKPAHDWLVEQTFVRLSQ